VLAELGPFQTFGIFFALNFVGWGAVAAVRLRELRRPDEWAYEMVVVALVGGVVGAKLWWAVDNGEFALGDIVSGAGLTWYGGLIGGALAMLAWARWRGMPFAPLAGIAAVGLPIGQAIGRVGCQVSGDGDYGTRSDLPWAMPFPDGVVPTEEVVHPAPMYESVALALVALVLWHLRDRVHPLALFGLYLLSAGVVRFLVELVRTNDEVLAGLTAAQVTAVLLVLAGAALLAGVSRRAPVARTAR
jgi:phosphatidylglycerol:prolipoprotein diacylglycerol transferase